MARLQTGKSTPVEPDDLGVDRLEFEPAKGGLVSHVSMKTKGDKYGPSYKRETAVHTKLADAVGTMKKHLAGHFGKPESHKKESSSMKRK